MLKKVNKIEHYVNKAIKTKLEDALTASYSISDEKIRKIVERPVVSANTLHRLVAEKRENHLYLVSGTALNSGQPLRVGFVGYWEIGGTNILPFYEHLLFEEGTSTMEDLGPCPGADLRRQADELAGQADLVAVLGHRMRLWQPRDGDWVSFPSVIRMVFEFHPGEEWRDIEQRLKSQSGNIARIRREKYTYEISHADEDFRYFYDRLYQPMVKERYKDYGAIVSENGLYQVFKKNGMLINVKNPAGEIVAAGLKYASGRVMYAIVNGVRDGDRDLVRRGALAAAHYFSIQYGFEQGMRCFDGGVGLPFQKDGIYQHKRLWGYQPIWNHWDSDHVLLWAPHSASAAVDWLRANPILPQFARWGGPAMRELYEQEEVKEKAA